ncbi:reverse transcriptase-like protein, partial [Klebsiella pneumoniae]|uniref:reverse transcriptase-like protein n=1 Tax=Klebsiella pneumoniae TaxID=573 RepID=UPI001D0E8F5E
MQKYLTMCKDHLKHFDYVSVEYISRMHNHEADLLSKLKLDDLQGHPSGTIWIEPLVAPSIDV